MSDRPTDAAATLHRARLRLAAPGSWLAKESMTVMAPDGAANVIVSTESVSAALTSHDYAMAQGRQLEAEFADYAELSLTAQPVAGVPGYVRRLRWQPPDGVPVFQVQAYAVLEPGRVLVGTATTALASMERLEPALQQILDSIALGD